MAGMPGRSGGHNRLSIQQHRMRGTLKPSRHLPAPPSEPATSWEPTAAQRAELGDTGRALVDCVLADNHVSVIEGAQLMEAAHAADELARLRTTAHADRRQVRLWSQHLVNVLRTLGVTHAT